jgi:hypothetical protein
MKMARILVALALLAVVAVSAQDAFAGCYTLSWNSCTPQVADKAFTGPAIYKLVISATGLGVPNIGHDSNLLIGPAAPDAWRFDDAGCQTGSQIAISGAAFAKTCPTILGGAPLPITQYGYDPVSKFCALRLAVAYNDVTPVAATRYTLWQVSFDHTYSVAGPGAPGETCGGANQGLALDLEFCQIGQSSGTLDILQPCAGDARCTWNGGPVVPTIPASWGKVKGLYR